MPTNFAQPEDQKPSTEHDADELSPEDFYMEGPYLIFTAAFHLRRGYCCNSGCRHCPYGHALI